MSVFSKPKATDALLPVETGSGRVGRVSALWRYPVKSMKGEEIAEAFLAYGGIAGDRLHAFRSTLARPSFPYFTAREQAAMLLYQPIWRDGACFVQTPEGSEFRIDDPALIRQLLQGAREGHVVDVLRSERALTDCFPVSLFSLQTVRQLGQELGKELDLRRFRASIYADLDSGTGFGEDAFVGHKLQIGQVAVIEIIERDARCKMITLDPDTGQADPNVMRQVARVHGQCAGVYGNVVREGSVKRGDAITLLRE